MPPPARAPSRTCRYAAATVSFRPVRVVDADLLLECMSSVLPSVCRQGRSVDVVCVVPLPAVDA
jgi:hypothetical protein